MTLFLTLTTFLAALSFVIEEPVSLKSHKNSILQNIKNKIATLTIGSLVILVFFLTSNGDFPEITIKPIFAGILGLSNAEISILLPIQLFSHAMIHINFLHLSTNLVYFSFCSVYESRVGSKRYLKVLLTGVLTSNFSALFYTEDTVFLGISGGISALIAAYFTDFTNIRSKQSHIRIFILILIGIFYIFFNHFTKERFGSLEQTDHLGHVFGALGGFIYTRYISPNSLPK